MHAYTHTWAHPYHMDKAYTCYMGAWVHAWAWYMGVCLGVHTHCMGRPAPPMSTRHTRSARTRDSGSGRDRYMKGSNLTLL